MKKFVYLYYGWGEPTQETMDAWSGWFASMGDRFVDTGNPFGGGREVTPTGTKELTPEMEPAVGYSIVNAESLDEAEKFLEGCPMINSVRVHEAMSM